MGGSRRSVRRQQTIRKAGGGHWQSHIVWLDDLARRLVNLWGVTDGYNHGIAPEALGADRVIQSFLELLRAPSRAAGARS
jgi:hypothetical protein